MTSRNRYTFVVAPNTTSRMATSRRRFHSFGDLAAVAGWTLLTVLVVAAGATGSLGAVAPLRTLIAGSYLFVVPGYALLAVLFPRAAALSLLERGVFSVGASLALVGLLGIPLDATPWGIQLWTLLAVQVYVVLILLGITLGRRRRLDPSDRAAPLAVLSGRLSMAWERRNVVGGGSRILQVAIVLAVVGAVGATAYTATTPLPSEQFTELYVLGAEGTIEGVPANATAGGSVQLMLGVRNHEFETETYGLQVQVREGGGDPEGVRWTTTRRLAHNETWETTRAFDVPADADQVRLQVLVFRGDPPESVVEPDRAYRRVEVVLSVEDQ